MRRSINQTASLIKDIYRRKGVVATITGGTRAAGSYAGFVMSYVACKLSSGTKYFDYDGQRLSYFHHPYHVTWMNERAVEIPIIRSNMKREMRILEVGNVLSHYMPIQHDVVDKYEIAPNVINADIVDFKPSEPYQLIISISTLEHVGWDETPKDPLKIRRAVNSLYAMLAPQGVMIVTVPVGYNPHLDAMLDSGNLTFTKIFYLKRAAKLDNWVQADWPTVRGSKYGDPYPAANALVVGIVKRA